MEMSPVTCRTLDDFYHVDCKTFEKQYKDVLSGYRQWSELEHADRWLVFPENIGPRLAIDESALSNGELYTFVTNRDRKCKERSLVAVVAGTKSEDVIEALYRIKRSERLKVEEVTLDLSDSIHKIVKTCFPKADHVMDRFHVQRLACDAVQEKRIEHRWEAIRAAAQEMAEARKNGESYQPFTFSNGDTRKELLARSRYLLFKAPSAWTERQAERAKILFEQYPDIQKAYGLCQSLRNLFSRIMVKDVARVKLALWCNQAEDSGFSSFNSIVHTFYEHHEEILNYYIHRATNAAAESFNAKIKLFRANLHGEQDRKFFLFRIAKLYAYPH